MGDIFNESFFNESGIYDWIYHTYQAHGLIIRLKSPTGLLKCPLNLKLADILGSSFNVQYFCCLFFTFDMMLLWVSFILALRLISDDRGLSLKLKLRETHQSIIASKTKTSMILNIKAKTRLSANFELQAH